MNDLVLWILKRHPRIAGALFVAAGVAIAVTGRETLPFVLVGGAMATLGLAWALVGGAYVRALETSPAHVPAGGLSVHPLPAGVRAMSLLGGVVLLILGMAFLSVALDGLDPGDWVALAVAVLVLAWGGWLVSFYVRASGYTVFLRGDALRVGDGRWIRWKEIAGLRNRAFLQRLDLCDAHGRRLASVEHQVEGADHLFRTIRANVLERAAGSGPYRRRFGGRAKAVAPVAGVWVALTGVLLWIAWAAGENLLFAPLLAAAILAAGFFFAWLEGGEDEFVELVLEEDALVLRTWTKTERIPREEVVAVTSELEGSWQGHGHRTRLTLGSGVRDLTPLGDPLEIYAALRGWRAGGAAGNE